jgi:tetratricopeptide (TPR) repeat protein
VFINYRGEDSHSYGALLHAELSRRFGPDLVFLDSESILPGADYVKQLLGGVRTARVVLAVISTRWLAASGPDGTRRIDDPADWIRRELVAAFAAGVRVIPVLTDGAEMPTESDLPTDLAPLARCQYRRLRHRDAAADLARLVTELADLDEDLAAAARESPPTRWPVPNQLPAAARYFTGRDDELARLLRLPDSTAQTLVVSAVDGIAGIGKTALAVLAAHHLTDDNRYPDGTLFLDLHGYSGRTPTDPADALEALLRGLGVPGPQVPPDTDARAALYRTITARRRALIVLDNARDETQIRPLLPGTPTCLVLITSRRRLAGLDDADHLSLDTLPPDEAVRLFHTMVGPDRDPGDQHTIDQIVHLCGLLPLAIRIAAARLKTSKTLNGHNLLEQLRTARDQERLRVPGDGPCRDQARPDPDRLGVLDDGERSVTAALAASYQHLPAEQQHAFAAFGLHPGVEFEPYAAAALLDTGRGHAGRLLEALEQVNLLDQPAPGRYRFHDLIRAYATSVHPETDRRAALDRLYDYYTRTTSRAMNIAYPYGADDLPRPPHSTTTSPIPPLPDEAAAVAWLDAEHPNLVAAAAHAAGHRPEHTTHQSTALHRHLRARGHYTDAHTLHQHALAAAGSTGNPAAHVAALTNLAYVHRVQGRLGPATECLTQALEVARTNGNHAGELDALTGLGRVHYAQGRYGPAVECCTQVLHTARATGNRPGELNGLIGLGWVHYAKGRYGPATDCLTSALQAARSTGHRPGELDALTGLGHVHHAQGRYSPAADCYRHVLALAHELGNRHYQFEGHLGLGRTHHTAGRPARALDALHQALALACDLDQPDDQARAHNGIAHAHHALGHPDHARRHWQQALHVLTTLDTPAADDVTAADIHVHLANLDAPTPPPLPI